MPRRSNRLAWPDALIAFALAVAGGLAVIVALRARWIPPVLANYVAHAWMAAIALAWFFLLRRRFPIGGLNRQMRPWSVVALVLIAADAAGTLASPPAARLHLPNLPTLVANLVFLAFVVGPTEELLFRGLIQTALNASIHARLGGNPSTAHPDPPPQGGREEARRGEGVSGWRLELGTMIGAVLFGLFHFINLGYQSLPATLQQVFTAVVIGLVFGILYDRTRNLVGASLAHSVADFSGTAIPLLAYVVINR